MKKRHAIAYCYPASPNAETHGSHGWYVEESLMLETDEWSSPYIPAGTEGLVYESPQDPELLELLKEFEGSKQS